MKGQKLIRDYLRQENYRDRKRAYTEGKRPAQGTDAGPV